MRPVFGGSLIRENLIAMQGFWKALQKGTNARHGHCKAPPPALVIG